MAAAAAGQASKRSGAGDASGHELLLVRRGPRSGAHVIIAVHSTLLGPALGGARLWRYPDLEAAITDALRLSSAMTLKAAAARLSLGGGKAVIFPPAAFDASGSARRALLHDFAEAVDLLGGGYITAEDMGTTAEDMGILSGYTQHVVGAPARRGGSGDPGDFTAAGVQTAMRACLAHRFGSPQLRGRSVALVGVGHVGEPLARHLARAGARLLLSDIEEHKRALASELGAEWASPEQALRAEVDVLAPCAMGGVIDARLSAELRAQIVCGSANNQLAEERLAGVLAARRILYAPDFIVNAGGLINVSLELDGYDRELALRRIASIETVLTDILRHAERAHVTPLEAAVELASERLAAARGQRAARRARGRPQRRSFERGTKAARAQRMPGAWRRALRVGGALTPEKSAAAQSAAEQAPGSASARSRSK